MLTMASEIGGTNCLSAVLILVACRYVESDLIVKPKDSEVLVGGSTFFNCSTTLTSAEIHWFHYPVGETRDRSFVYGYDQFYSTYLGRFQMEKNIATGVYNLIVSSATIDDAGRFECQDDTGRGDKDAAELIVLDENPECQSNMKPEGLIGPNICGFKPEDLHLACAARYHGNQAPVMHWKEVGSNNLIEDGVSRNVSSNRVIYYLNIEINSRIDGSSLQCVTTRSTAAQYGCISDTVTVKGMSPAYVTIICTVVGLVGLLMAMLLGFKLGMIWQGYRLKQKESTTAGKQHLAKGKKTEQIPLTEKDAEQFQAENETLRLKNEQFRMENERLLAKVNDLEQLRYNTDNIRDRTAISLVHTIQTTATEEGSITGMAILENSLFVVRKNCIDIEVYDSRTFVFDRLIKNQPFTNPLDIAASKEDKRLYIFNRRDQLPSAIVKVNIAGELGEGKIWVTENDDGRLSTFESNLIVCLLEKRYIIEYSPEGETVNTVRLSPRNGFNQIWHALKLTGLHFAVSHSKAEGGQRVCVVDINGSVLAHYEEYSNLLIEAFLPLCLVEACEESLLVADARHKKVLLLNSRLKHKVVLINTVRNQIPVRICLTEARDLIFVAVNSGECAKQEKWTDGRILIYNITK